MFCAQHLEHSTVAMHSDQYSLHERLVAEQRHSAWVRLQLDMAKRRSTNCILRALKGMGTFATRAIVRQKQAIDAKIVAIRGEVAALQLSKVKLNPFGSGEVLARLMAEEGTKQHLRSRHAKLTFKRTLLWYVRHLS